MIAGLFFILALLTLPSANAHSNLISSNPVAGANLERMPESFSVTFNEELISIKGESINTLTLQGADGTSYALLAPTVAGAVLSAKTGSAQYPPGDYLLKYRVVSLDGHPITGEIRFSTQSSTTVESDLGVEVTYQEEEQERFPFNIGFIIVAALFLILSIVFGVRFVRRDSR